MRCSICGGENQAGKKFCGDCGMPLDSRCAKCGADNLPGKRFCGDCGAALAGNSAVSQSLSSSIGAPGVKATTEQSDVSAAGGERKMITALFADIKGSTELMRDLDPEEARAVVDPVLELMMEAVHHYDGYVVQSAGDGIFALFGAPVAHEDHPQRAVHAALAMQQQLHQRVRQKGRRLTPAPLELRIGINTGEVVVRLVHTGGHTEYTPVGHAANLAARMQSVAPADAIVISKDTQRLVEGYFELRELGPTEVKGVDQPLDVYQVTAAGPLHGHFELAVHRGLTKFVGRCREIGETRRALELAQSGQGQILAVMGTAGTGKSRLFYEFKASLPAECKLLEAYSVSFGKASAWLPVLELLNAYLGIQQADDPTTQREKLRTALAALDPALSDTHAYLFGLLGIAESPDPLTQMDPQIKRRRTLDALKRLVLRESLNQAVVIIFEDLHWIDGETQVFLDLLADSIASARVLMLVNYRPEYRHEWNNKTYYSQLRLDPLGRESAAEMLSSLLGDGAELNPLKRLVTERTEGNPFFIEEMVQALFDEGALVRDNPHPGPLPEGEGSKGREQRIGTVKVARSLSQLRLPPTVQGILAARIDRLAGEQKELLQTLAVMGRESPLPLITQVAQQADGDLELLLSALQAREFIYEQRAADEVEYVFKHALTQEVAYNSLLIERRKLLHERAGAAIEALYAGRLENHLNKLAHHYQHSSNTAKAIEYLGHSGRQALQHSSHAEAIKLLTSVLQLLQSLPETHERFEQELALQLGLGAALMAAKGWSAPEVGHAFVRARELCREIGETQDLFQALAGLWSFYFIRAEPEAMLELAEQLLSIAQSAEDAAFLPAAHHAMGQALFMLGNFMPARTCFELSCSLYDPARYRLHAVPYFGCNIAVHSLGMSSTGSWFLGFPDRAVDEAERAVALARNLAHPFSLCQVLLYLVCVHYWRRETMTALKFADEVFQLANEHGFQAMSAAAIGLRGAALIDDGQADEGVAQLREGFDSARALGMEVFSAIFLGCFGTGYGILGQIEEGIAALREAMSRLEVAGVRFYYAELFRLTGELMLKRPQAASNPNIREEAESYFRQAIEIARRHSAKSLELRATTSLARLLAKQGHRAEARAMLAEIYNWFTEGFDTLDLKDAKALLEELNASI
jgi:class 3 adenylate cyclase/predicted ATPase